MPRKLRDSVVVITGASSGIGRATALQMAERGATVVVAARREQALQDVVSECETLGGRALAVPTDVTDERAVQQLAQHALENFGRIDVWVNNAAVTLFARFEEAPPEACRRVIETNLFGYIHGARAALQAFREQGSGILIQNASVYGTIGAPFVSAYIVTKFAIRGLSECLRQEVRDVRDIAICTILPASIDTPLFQHAGNYTGRAVKPLTPIYFAEKVARAIVECAIDPAREVVVGNAGRVMRLLHALAPPLYEAYSAWKVERDHFQSRPASPTSGNLFEPMPQWTGISGGWKPASSPARGRTMLASVAVIAPALLAWWVLGNRRRHSP